MPKLGSNLLETFKVYQEGKSRRYTLLFAVNGGAFTVFQFSMGIMPSNVTMMLLIILAASMIGFTIVMCHDIWNFGTMMSKEADGGLVGLAFQPAGKRVLRLIGLLIVAVWSLSGGLAVLVLKEVISITLPSGG